MSMSDDTKNKTAPQNPDAVIPTYHPSVPMNFSRFMNDTLKRESKKVVVTANNQESHNPNKEYIRRYYEGATSHMWLGGKPRYR